MERKTFDCQSCGLCCRKGTHTSITPEEAKVLRNVGTELTYVGSAGPRSGRGHFVLETDCGHLKQDETGKFTCAIYGNPERPQVCQTFSAGAYYCRQLREKAGLK